MKNHIKNCIKIMGLATIPFGTAQIHGDPTEHKIRVTERRDGKVKRYYSVEVQRQFGGENFGCIEFAWDGWELIRLGDDVRERKTSPFLSLGMGKVEEKSEILSENKSERYFWYVASFFIERYPFKRSNGRSPVAFDPGFHCELVLRVENENREVCEAILSIQGRRGWEIGKWGSTTEDQNLAVISSIPVHFEKVGKVDVIGDLYDTGCLPWQIRMRLHKEVDYMYMYCLPDYCSGEFSSESEIEEDDDPVSDDSRDEEPKFNYRSRPRENAPEEARDRIKALFEKDKRRREKDPEREKERRMREEAQFRARDRIRKFIRIDQIRREIKEDKKIDKNEIMLEEPKVEDKKEEKLFEKSTKEDYFKGFDAFKESLSAKFEAYLKKSSIGKNEIKISDKKSKKSEIFNSKDCFELLECRLEFSEVVNPNPIKIEDEKEDAKIEQSEINFEKSPVESICNESSEKSERSERRGGYSSCDSDKD